MKKFAVLGHPVAHSLSPVMHAANFRSVGLDATYEKFDVAPEELADFVREMQRKGYSGLNITVPHKIAVLPLVDRPDESVGFYGACNTLKFENDGAISGYNTDVIGFVAGLAAHGFSLKGKNVTVIGCGGAGSALAMCACREGASAVSVADLRADGVARLVSRLGEIGSGAAVSGLETLDGTPSDAQKEIWGEAAAKSDLIVNATPMGLHPGEPSALPPACFRPGQFVLDIVPTKTFPPTAAAARAAGATAVDGLEFLVGQGAKSFEIWTGLAADRAAMLAAVRNA
ncbi:MAG: shikimate dehydrogenase [Kiritimatiellae bacterium]|nr:shikimate dehydrogenase [Kiritimatiellia bacterium]